MPVHSNGEFLVNTETLNYQDEPSIASLSSGGFVISWVNYSGTFGDSSDYSIKAQVFDASGAQVGEEFLVNTETSGTQTMCAVTGLTVGGFVVTWFDNSGTLGDSSGSSIKAQIFDASGEKVGAEFLVNTETGANQTLPSICSLSDGGFAIVWEDLSHTLGDDVFTSIKAQVFNSSGGRVGSEFLVNTETASWQNAPSITGLVGGGFVVTWQDGSGTLGDGSDYSIKMQMYDASGSKIGAETLVNSEKYSVQSVPTITSLAGGGFVVAWQDASGTLGDISGSSIKSQVFDSMGQKVGSETLVNTVTMSEQNRPAITSLKNGGFIITWEDASGGINDSCSVKGQIFNASGEKVGSEFLVNTETAADQQFATIAGLQGGGFVVSWHDYSGTLGDASNTSIKAKIFDAGGNVVIPGEGGVDPSDPDFGVLALDTSGSWAQDPDTGIYRAVDLGTVWVGHADGTQRLLRIDGATIEVGNGVARFTGATVYAANGSVTDPLFTGSFNIDLETMQIRSFTETTPDFPPGTDFDIAGLLDFRFGSMRIGTGAVTFGIDVVLPGFIDTMTTGAPLSLVVDSAGLSPTISTIGTGSWFNEPLDFPLRASDNLNIAFSQIGLSWSGAEDALYLMGRASISAEFAGYARDFTIDLAGAVEPETSIFAPGDKYLRYSSADGWDFVGSLTYNYQLTDGRSDHLIKAWGIQRLSLDVDTIDERVSGSISADIPFLGGFRVTGTVTAFWDPLDLDGFRLDLDGLRVPAFGVFLTGGFFATSGWADPDRTSAQTTIDVEVGVDFSLMHPQRSPIQGTLSGALVMDTIDQSRMFDGVSLAFNAASRLSYLLSADQREAVRAGGSSGLWIADQVADWFDVSQQVLLNFELLSFDGTWTYDWARGSGTVSADVELLGGVVAGHLTFRASSELHFTLSGVVAGRLPEDMPLIGGKQLASMNFYADLTADNTWNNDFLMFWVDFSVLGVEFSRGARINLGGGMSLIGGEEIPPRGESVDTMQRLDANALPMAPGDGSAGGSWEFGAGTGVVILSAQWTVANRAARLVIVTPDGERLTEADLEGRRDVALVGSLNSAFGRSVAVKASDIGIWGLEVVSSDDLGDVDYTATVNREGPSFEITRTRYDDAKDKLYVTIDAGAGVAGGGFSLFYDPDQGAGNGIAASDSATRLIRGVQTIVLDTRDVDAGSYRLYGVLVPNGDVPITEYAAGRLDINYVVGGPAADRLTGTLRGEVILGKAGNDLIRSMGGEDRVSGGMGVDTISFADINSAVISDLAVGTAETKGKVTQVDDVENVTGGGASDRLAGDANRNVLVGLNGSDVLSGAEGSDKLMGGNGNDRLIAGAAADRLTGGAGADILTGGGGLDVFVFNAASDSAPKQASADLIVDFQHMIDRIDLSAIDASASLMGNSTFVFVGTHGIGTSKAGEISYRKVDAAGASNDLTLISIDTDGDRSAEALIKLKGLYDLRPSDFML